MKQSKNSFSIFEKHSKDVTCLTVDEKQNLVFTGSLDGSLRVWDLETRKQVKVNMFHRKSIDFLAWSDKNKALLVVFSEQDYSNLILFDSGINSILGEVKDLNRVINLALVNNESSFYVQFKHGRFSLYSLLELTALRYFVINEALSLVVFIRDSIVYFDSCNLNLWDTKTEYLKACIKANVSRNSVAIASEDFIVWTYFNMIYYTTAELDLVQSLNFHTSPVISVCNQLTLFASLSSDCLLVIWDIQSRHKLWALFLDSPSFRLKLVKSSSIVIADIYRTVKFINQNANWEFPGHDFEVTCQCYSLDKKLIVTGSRDCSVRVWERETGSHLVAFKGHEQFITTVTLTQSGRFLVSGSQDSSIAIWDLNQKTLNHVFRIFNRPVSHLVSLARNELILACDVSPSLYLLSLDTQKFWSIASNIDQVVRSLKLISREKYCICLTRGFILVFKFSKFYLTSC